MLRLLLLPLFAVALWACAPISEDQCRGGDWGAIGLKDGKDGRDISVLSKYAETCGEFGISPDKETYLAARQSGLTFYCTPQNAYSVGRAGKRLNNVCQPGIQQSIIPAYKKGRQYFEINEEIDRLHHRIDELRDELRLVAKQDTTEEDGRITGLLLDNEIDDLRHDIFMLELQRDRYESYP